jgi:hypothetical protein
VLYDSGMDGAVPYLVLECLEGEVLAERIRRSLMPIPEAVRVARDVAAALHYAHRHGVIHRDVTARNIWLGPHRRTVVQDAAWNEPGGPRYGGAYRGHMGTLAYMAPELRASTRRTRAATSTGSVSCSTRCSRARSVRNEQRGARPARDERGSAAAVEPSPGDWPPARCGDAAALARERTDRFPTSRPLPPPSPAPRRALGPRGSPLPRVVLGDAPLRPDPLYGDRAARAEDAPELGTRLEFALRALLQRGGDVRVVPLPAEAAATPQRPRGRRCNALLETVVARDGSRVRASFAATDLLRAAQFAGDMIEGRIGPVRVRRQFRRRGRTRARHRPASQATPGRAPIPRTEILVRR